MRIVLTWLFRWEGKGTHMTHGQREGNFRNAPHMRRLILRKLRKYPLGLTRLILEMLKLERSALRRRHNK